MKKQRLEKAIEYAEKILKMYQEIPEGMFGSILITNDIVEGKEILKNFDKTKVALVDRIIEKLESVE